MIINPPGEIFPKIKTFGGLLRLSDPTPDRTLIRQAKRFLVESARKTGKTARNVKFTVQPNYELVDPDTGERVLVSNVAIKFDV